MIKFFRFHRCQQMLNVSSCTSISLIETKMVATKRSLLREVVSTPPLSNQTLLQPTAMCTLLIVFWVFHTPTFKRNSSQIQCWSKFICKLKALIKMISLNFSPTLFSSLSSFIMEKKSFTLNELKKRVLIKHPWTWI